MSTTRTTGIVLPDASGRAGALRVRRRRRPLTFAGPILVAVVVLFVIAPLVAPMDPLAQDVAARLQGPSVEHWLGTDALGRDVFSRLLLGGTSALIGVAIAMATMMIIGIPWGLAAGYLGGTADEILMRIADAFISLPGIVLAIAITGVVGPSLENSMIAVGVVIAPTIARILRSTVLPLRRSDFVLVARSLGVSAPRVALRHVLPNSMGPVVVQICSLAALCLVVQAGLAFIGLGVQPPDPSWGGDLANAYRRFTSSPLATIAPGLTITLCALLLNVVGDGLRQRLRIE
ncbi:ABC transporter permease [Microbacterium sp. No. 7]|uniref:ABC transporter permease n=1 Tax=Microbacterium sp. No. 7 TaxID=1714373 RepID=UPI0006D136CD|nr:ABC transporter permease [Microbacterium sp. No. 7]ALJ21905.1 hypothetical protein AOA12_19175 [Microbacterium sp. No. 7]